MSKFSALLVAFASFLGFSVAASAGETGIVCQWGVPGLNESDPNVILGMNMVEVEFKPGSTELSENGKSTITTEENRESEVTIASQTPGTDEQFHFSYSEANSISVEASVSTSLYTGKIPGLKPEAAKKVFVSTEIFKFPQGDSQSLPGYCFVLK